MTRDFSKKIFEGKSLEEISNYINQKIENNQSLIEEYDGVAKWNTLSTLTTTVGTRQQRILQFISYIDEMMLSEKEKIYYLITLSSLLQFGNLEVETLDDGNLFMIVDFFRIRMVGDIAQLISIVNTQQLLLVVRFKTLDGNIRTEILNYVINQYINQKVDPTQKDNFLAQMMVMIQESEYYKLLEVIHS